MYSASSPMKYEQGQHNHATQPPSQCNENAKQFYTLTTNISPNLHTSLLMKQNSIKNDSQTCAHKIKISDMPPDKAD